MSSVEEQFEALDVDALNIEAYQAEGFTQSRSTVTAPRVRVTENPKLDDARVKVIHAEAMNVTADTAFSGKVPVQSFVAVDMFYGESGLYVALTPERAEAIATALINGAKEVREILEKVKTGEEEDGPDTD
jgi:hypothetical protein